MTAINLGRPVQAERVFYTGMALLIAAYVAFGFGRNYAASLAPPGLPFWVHLHGAVFTTWIILFAVQSWLVGRRAIDLHRKLGFASIALVAAMIPLGIATTILCVKRGAVPPFFTPGLMLALDFVGLASFVGVYTAAVLMRRRSDWHKRLMLCGTILLSSPALGRILPMSALGPLAPLALTIVLLALAACGMAFDLGTRRRIHPAYAWGSAAITFSILAAGPIGFSRPMLAFVGTLTA